MNFKSGKLYTTIREFDKKNGKYEINGIEDNEAVFLYKEPEKTFTPIPKGNYRITTEDNNRYLNIDNEIERKAERYQVIVTNNLKSSKYEADFPELEVLQEKINLIVEDLENIVSYLKKTGVKTDELSMQQTLPKLEPNTLWVSNENGEIDYIPYSDLNRKFDNMLELLKKTTEETLENKKQQVLSDVEKEKIQQIKAFTQTIETKIREVESYLESHMDEKEQTYSEIFEIKLQEVTGLKSKIEKEIQELEKKTMSALKEEKEQAVSQIERKKETAIKEVSSVVATYFEEHSDELKGPQGEKGPKGAKGDRGLT
ncbi:MICOS complex subunit MIC60, partial [Fusobacterium necrophorum]